MKKTITLLLLLAIAVVFSACTNPQKTFSKTQSLTSNSSFLDTNSKINNVEEVTSPPDISNNEETSTTTSSTNSSTNTSQGISFGENKVFHPTSGLPFKCLADTKTGLSWDGVSPIIYTYPDGATGTEPKDGATYECLPGWIETYKVIRDGVGRIEGTICSMCGRKVGIDNNINVCYQKSSNAFCEQCGTYTMANTCHFCTGVENNTFYCAICGKIYGDGLNGTCLRYWTSGDHNCMWCGETNPSRACHTCTHGCQYCGRPMGNGLDGTCYRDYFNSTMCLRCGANIPTNTCHNCG